MLNFAIFLNITNATWPLISGYIDLNQIEDKIAEKGQDQSQLLKLASSSPLVQSFENEY